MTAIRSTIYSHEADVCAGVYYDDPENENIDQSFLIVSTQFIKTYVTIIYVLCAVSGLFFITCVIQMICTPSKGIGLDDRLKVILCPGYIN